jgi:F0F1-type ATP synthase assembly protein I
MSNNEDASFYVSLYQWSARASMIAIEMVIPAVVGIGLDRLLGTVALFAILGVVLGMALGFWQLIKIAQSDNGKAPEMDRSTIPESPGIGVDKSPHTRDNRGV